MSIYKETIKRFLVGGKAQAQVTRTAELDLAQSYADCASLGATVDVTLFENSLKALPEVARNEAINYLVPGAYKLGMIYGFNSDTKSVSPFPFSRTSSATYIDKNGQMQTAPPNMPRIDYDPLTGECKGYLMEAASTNLIEWSNDFTYFANPSLNIGITEILTSYGKPFNSVTKLTEVASAGLVLNYTNTSIANATYCFSITLRAGNVNTVSIGIGATADAEGDIWGTDNNCTSRIIRGPGIIDGNEALVTITGLSTTEDTVVEVTRKYINAGLLATAFVYPGGATSTTLGAYMLISCAQFEASSTATSYIPTEGGIGIRTKDNFDSGRDITPYPSVSVYMNLSSVGIGPNWIYLLKGNVGILYRGQFSNFQADDLINVVQVYLDDYTEIDRGKAFKAITSWGSALKLCVDSSYVQASAFSGAMGAPGALKLSSSFPIMYIKALAIIPRQLTDAEHITATTL